MDRKFVLTAFVYAIAGLVLGMVMAESGDHGQLVTHAHIMLVGFVVSFVYGVTHRLWAVGESRLRTIQFWAHQSGTLVLVVGLFLMYGQFAAPEKIGPVLGVGSALVLLGMLLMAFVFLRATRANSSSARLHTT